MATFRTLLFLQHSLVGIPAQRRPVLLPLLCICKIICLLVSLWTHGFFCIQCNDSLMQHSFQCSNCSTFGHWKPCQAAPCPLDLSPSFFDHHLAFRRHNLFLALLLLSLSLSEWAVSPRSSGEWYLETKTWTQRMLMAIWGALPWGPQQTDPGYGRVLAFSVSTFISPSPTESALPPHNILRIAHLLNPTAHGKYSQNCYSRSLPIKWSSKFLCRFFFCLFIHTRYTKELCSKVTWV